MTRRAVVVTSDLDLGSTWLGWLRAAGHVSTGCVGPERTHGCPATRGSACHLRDGAALIVIDPASDVRGVCAGACIGRALLLARDDPAARDRRRFLLELPGHPSRRRS